MCLRRVQGITTIIGMMHNRNEGALEGSFLIAIVYSIEMDSFFHSPLMISTVRFKSSSVILVSLGRQAP